MTPGRQLALPFAFTAHYHAAAFLPDQSNAAARAWLETPWPSRRLALWGGAGCGKTHLLHIWAERTGAAVLPGPGLRGLLPTIPPGGVAVDDADAAPEEPLLHLLNAAAEADRPVLLAARDAPARWGTRLPDLASRLRATAAVGIAAPGDTMLRALLARLLVERQMAVPQMLQDWMLLRLPRTPAALREAAARLDRAGGAVTRALAESVVAELVEADDEHLSPAAR
jgi:chromosomal replication initiation ATPase DnaA